jgi:hypothetical protein
MNDGARTSPAMMSNDHVLGLGRGHARSLRQTAAAVGRSQSAWAAGLTTRVDARLRRTHDADPRVPGIHDPALLGRLPSLAAVQTGLPNYCGHVALGSMLTIACT